MAGRRPGAPTRPASAPGGWTQVWGVLSTVVAPVTLVTAVLFYFGYVSTRAQFAYFGVDVDTLGYSTQDFVMRAPQSLLVPALGVLLLAALLVWADGAVRRRLVGGRRAGGDRARAGEPDVVERTVAGVGGALLGAGVLLVAGYGRLAGWVPYPLVTAAVLGLGALLVERSLAWQPHPAGRFRVERPLLLFVVVVATFWATATVAQWSGRGAARALAADLRVLPDVVVDTPGRLYPGDDAVREQGLPADAGGYAFRYSGLRLLAEAEGTLLLVPEEWSTAGSTFVVPLADVRVRYRFVDDPP